MDDTDKLIDILKTEKVRVLVFGEHHREDSCFRRFGLNVLNSLRDVGFTHLAVEMLVSDTPLIEEYLRRDIEVEVLIQRFVAQGGGMRTQFTREYFELLKVAAGLGYELMYVNTVDRRDQQMHDQIAEVINSSETTRIVFWVGLLHACIRPSVERFHTKPNEECWSSTTELLADWIAPSSIYSVGEVFYK